MSALVVLIGGLVVLCCASDRFVVGSARLATALRVPPVVVGAVIVGFGTSAPEVIVSVLAAGAGDAALAAGNLVGSNLANLTLVLGCAGLVGRVVVDSGTIRREGPLSGAAVVLFGLAVTMGLGMRSGIVLLIGMAGALALMLWAARTARASEERPLEEEVAELEGPQPPALGWSIALAAAGLLGTLLGAHLVVTGAVEVALRVGLSQGFVGLTIVAVGTSLPELVTGVQAARRGEDELVVGNVLGSNVFNSLAAGGLVALVGPGLAVDERMPVAVATMAVAATLAAVLLVWRCRIPRPVAAGLLLAYGVTVPLLAS